MAFTEIHRRQAALLVRVLPFVATEDSFALKGGTAINLFHRDMPRLSIDIDLAYVPVQPRKESLAAIEAALMRIAQRIRAGLPKAQVTEGRPGDEKTLIKLFPRSEGVQIEIEVSPVMRGSIDAPDQRTVSPAVEEAFGFAEMPVLPFADLYGGKLVATLDRQHPRDLFDGRELLANEGIDDKLRCAFIVYLICHSRPMHEILTARRKDISALFARDFEGMTTEPVSLKALTDTREEVIESIVGKMPDAHRQFLISFERGAPDWKLLGLPSVAELPAVKWRQLHLDKYGCGDSGGFPIAPVNGNPVAQLGINLPEVVDRIRKAFLPERPVGAAYFKVKGDWPITSTSDNVLGALFFLTQSIRQEFGKASEEQLEIRGYTVRENGEQSEVSTRACANLIREFAEATRTREPIVSQLAQRLPVVEAEICMRLRRPTDEEFRNQVRRAVWPLAAVIFTR